MASLRRFLKKRYTLAEFAGLLQRNGLYKDFKARIDYDADMFPVERPGKVEYKLAYDAYKIKMNFIMDVRVICDGRNRYSQVKDIRVVKLDDYIDQAFRDEAFRNAYDEMLGYMQGGLNKAQDMGEASRE